MLDEPLSRINRRFSLENRGVLYTGAAGGLGLETTLELLAEGARVVALDNNPEKVRALQDAAPGWLGDRLQIIELDLRDQGHLEATVTQLAEDGLIDVVVNNAAIYPSKPFADYSMQEMREVHAVNVEAALVCVRAALPSMKERGWGRIINVSSITLTGGWENLAPYVQSKGALIGLTRAWAREFGKWGITSNAIAPGAFPTDAEKIHADPQAYQQFVLDHQSIKRRGNAADIASVILFLASEASSFVTGQTIAVDGGWTMC